MHNSTLKNTFTLKLKIILLCYNFKASLCYISFPIENPSFVTDITIFSRAHNSHCHLSLSLGLEYNLDNNILDHSLKTGHD